VSIIVAKAPEPGQPGGGQPTTPGQPPPSSQPSTSPTDSCIPNVTCPAQQSVRRY
jgi:hypothetical protein